jgi:hypothetical protein
MPPRLGREFAILLPRFKEKFEIQSETDKSYSELSDEGQLFSAIHFFSEISLSFSAFRINLSGNQE